MSKNYCPGHGYNKDWYHVNPNDCPQAAAEEPSYMMFARSNVRGGAQTSPIIVESLLARIDRLEKTVSAVKALTDKAFEGHTYVLPGGYPSRPVEAFDLRNALEGK